VSELLHVLIGKDLIEGPINTRVKLLPWFWMVAAVSECRVAIASKTAGPFRFLHRAVISCIGC